MTTITVELPSTTYLHNFVVQHEMLKNMFRQLVAGKNLYITLAESEFHPDSFIVLDSVVLTGETYLIVRKRGELRLVQ